jgi:NitT/TauT family transport system ATP-binding protein
MLEVRNLRKEFDGSVVLDNISFRVPEGQFLCIIGRSGCGKTTLLRLIAGLERPTSGEILWKGEPLKGLDGSVGFVFQEYALFPWRTAEKNIEFGLEIKGIPKEERKRIVDHYIELVGLKDARKKYPRELSGGMRQRVAIARVLAVDPEILLMDEPFGALDAQTRNLMQTELLRIWEREHKTVLFVTHSVDEALFLADRVIVLSMPPAKIKEDIKINVERPRKRTDPRLLELRERVLKLIWEG